MVDARDLKSLGTLFRAGSIPALGTIINKPSSLLILKLKPAKIALKYAKSVKFCQKSVKKIWRKIANDGLRKIGDTYCYDFTVDGKRYLGTTKTQDKKLAQNIADTIKADVIRKKTRLAQGYSFGFDTDYAKTDSISTNLLCGYIIPIPPYITSTGLIPITPYR